MMRRTHAVLAVSSTNSSLSSALEPLVCIDAWMMIIMAKVSSPH